ncbi:hypothetical protein [Helicobacter pylori]|uniref:hypothetical protein n=1 Tax=Helicobacter pylori TaxID=210 RepID=UPI002739F5B2|nr:hypothetical protein [Helicobacter pylori]
MNEFKNDVFTTPKAKEYIDIASGFHRLFKNDAKIAESLKPAITKNLSQSTHPNASDSNLSLLVFNMPRTKTQVVTKDLLRLMCFLRSNHLQHP